MNKRCKDCSIEKCATEFYKHSNTSDRLRSECKTCFLAKAKLEYSKNPAKKIQKAKEWDAKNKDRRATITKRYVENNREKLRERSKTRYKDNPLVQKGYQLKLKYRLSLEEYQQMKVEQEFRCYICNRTENELGRPLCIDHCHNTGRVRKLLCNGCNTGLGHFGEDVKIIERAIKYLLGAA